jgi:hypothetical protein
MDFWIVWWIFVFLLGIFYFGLAVHEAISEKKSISKTLMEYLQRVIDA